MLNLPTLWTALVVHFLTMGMIWGYVVGHYPKLEAARYWAASALLIGVGAVLGMLGVVLGSLMPLFIAGTLTVFASCLVAMGIRRFYDRPVHWRLSFLVTGLTSAALLFFIAVDNDIHARIFCYSLGTSLPVALTLKLLMEPQEGRTTHGARLSATVIAAILGIFAIRVAGNFAGFDFAFSHSNNPQGVALLALMFLSMAMNFGFLLMAMDRLRNEVADLALLDDLTGVGNRRMLVQRLVEECSRSERSGETFSLLVIDLDGFKSINDTYGHAAGDACLQHFTLMAQTRLRPGDLLARTGGDEFCIVLPSSTLREGAMIARRVLEVCRQDAEGCVGQEIPIAVSIGVAQWNREIGSFPDRLIAAADHALYVAKKDGKNCYATYEAPPPLAPEPETILERALRRHA